MKKLIDSIELINNVLKEKDKRETWEKLKRKTGEEQEEYKRYNKDLLSYMKTKADFVNKLKSELSPLLEKAIEIFVDYLVIDDFEEEIVDDTYFYKEPEIKKDNVIADEYCPFQLTSKSLEKINKEFEVDLKFSINEILDMSTFNISDYDEIIYGVNKNINGTAISVYNNLADNNSADLILVGTFSNPEHKLKIYTRKYIKDDYIENLISAIFLDSGLYIVNPVEKITENNKDCCCNNEPTEKELKAIESIKRVAEDVEKFLKDK